LTRRPAGPTIRFVLGVRAVRGRAKKPTLLLGAALLAIGLAACGSDGDSDGDGQGGSAQSCAPPSCGACKSCLEACVCSTGNATECVNACGQGSGGASGTSGTGGTGATFGAGGTGTGGAGVGGTAGGLGSGGTGTGGAGGGGSGGTDGAGGTTGTGGTDGTGGSGTGGTNGVGGSGGSSGSGGSGGTPPVTPVYRINLRVHVGQSTLTPSELSAILNEVNSIWHSQAGICFEIHTVNDDQTQQGGYDLWFVPSVPGEPSVNGIYRGDHDIWSRDNPSLGSAPNPVQDPASRTSAHELGHGLTLDHYNGFPDSNDSLMSSGRLGWQLHDFEIQAARARAAQKALPDTTPTNCGPPVIN
jgi:hypothetical protein